MFCLKKNHKAGSLIVAWALALVAVVAGLTAFALPHEALALKVIPGTVAEGQTAQGSINRNKAVESDDIGDIAAGKQDGIYYGSGEGFKSEVTVAVTVKDGKVASVEVVSQADDQSYFTHAEGVEDKVVEYQRANVNAMAGATYSSKGILAAVENALGPDSHIPVTAQAWFRYGIVGLVAALLVVAAWFAHKALLAPTPAQRARQAGRQRLATQLAFFIVAPSTFASGLAGIKYFFQTVYEADMDGVAPVFEVTSLVVVLVALLAFTVLFGRVFCGYACSFGLFGDVLWRARQAVCAQMRKHRDGSRGATGKGGAAKGGKSTGEDAQKGTSQVRAAGPRHVGAGAKKGAARVAELLLCSLKYVVLALVMFIVWMGYTDALGEASPWVAFAQLASLSTRRLTVLGCMLLAIVALGSLVRERFFCRYLCPMGAVFSILPTMPWARMRKAEGRCLAHCTRCHQVCPMGVEPKGGLFAKDCIACERCIEACPAGSAHWGLKGRAASPAAGVPASPAVARMEAHVDEVLGGNTGEATAQTPKRAWANTQAAMTSTLVEVHASKTHLKKPCETATQTSKSTEAGAQTAAAKVPATRIEACVDGVLVEKPSGTTGKTSRNVGCRKGGAAPSSRWPAVALGLSLLLMALLWLVGATQYLPLPPYL